MSLDVVKINLLFQSYVLEYVIVALIYHNVFFHVIASVEMLILFNKNMAVLK